MTKIITDPSNIFRRFAGAYSQLSPHVAVTKTYHQQAFSVIDDICAGRDIEAFASDPVPHEAKPDTGAPFCEMLIAYFSMLRFAMAEQRATKVVPSRAAELLYNFDVADDFTQPIMRLRGGAGSNAPGLVSTRRYTNRFDGELRLTLPRLHDATSWKLAPGFDFEQ